MKGGGKSVDKAGVGELESGGGKPGGIGAGAGEEDFVGHFAEGEAEGEGGDGEKCGAMKVGSEGAGELGVGDRVGCGEVEGAGEWRWTSRRKKMAARASGREIQLMN